MVPTAFKTRAKEDSAGLEAKGLAQEIAALRRRIRSALQDQERKHWRLRPKTTPLAQDGLELTRLDRMLAEAQRALEKWQSGHKEIG
jgi:hypothetical protein